MTFAEKIKDLTPAQLDRLEKALLALQGASSVDADKLLAAISAEPPLTADAANLVGARAYAISLVRRDVSYEALRAQALEEFQAGRLNPQQPKPRR